MRRGARSRSREDGGVSTRRPGCSTPARADALDASKKRRTTTAIPDPDRPLYENGVDASRRIAGAGPEEGALHRGLGLSPYDASVLVAERETRILRGGGKLTDKSARQLAANWVINELFGRLNKEGRDITGSPVSAAQLAAIVDLIGDGTISGKIAKDLFEIVWTEGGDPRELVEARGMKQVTDLSAIEKVVDEIIAANPDKVAQARAKPQALGWFVGQVMKSSGGKANPQAVNDLLKSKLGL